VLQVGNAMERLGGAELENRQFGKSNA